MTAPKKIDLVAELDAMTDAELLEENPGAAGYLEAVENPHRQRLGMHPITLREYLTTQAYNDQVLIDMGR